MKAGTYQVPLIGLSSAAKRDLHAKAAKTRAEQQRRARSWKSPGRPIGKPAGTWVTDVAELGQCVLLCSACDHKFKPAHKRYGYHRDTYWKQFTGGVGGACDGCREPFPFGLQLYVHQSYVGAGTGYGKPR